MSRISITVQIQVFEDVFSIQVLFFIFFVSFLSAFAISSRFLREFDRLCVCVYLWLAHSHRMSMSQAVVVVTRSNAASAVSISRLVWAVAGFISNRLFDHTQYRVISGSSPSLPFNVIFMCHGKCALTLCVRYIQTHTHTDTIYLPFNTLVFFKPTDRAIITLLCQSFARSHCGDSSATLLGMAGLCRSPYTVTTTWFYAEKQPYQKNVVRVHENMAIVRSGGANGKEGDTSGSMHKLVTTLRMWI